MAKDCAPAEAVAVLRRLAAGHAAQPDEVLSGLPFTGHTEYIAELCGAPGPCLRLAGERFSVMHVSTHRSLRAACELSVDRMVRATTLGYEAVRLLGHSAPRVAVCGLNPHAGEHGLFGSEDEEFIRPAVERCRTLGLDVEGAGGGGHHLYRAARGSHDLVVAMYHDQGPIP